MPSTSTLSRSAVRGAPAWLAAAALIAAPACGPKIPDHDGYKNAREQGWKRPSVLQFDEDNEAEADADVSYPKRKRARWFAVDLPGDGEITVELNASLLGVSEEDAELIEFDLAFEVLDKGFRVLTRADREEQDAGDRKKSRTLIELAQGRYYIHVYAQERLDQAEFTLRVKYKPGSVEPASNFPDEVPLVAALPVVPAFDDTPADARAKPRRKPCRGRNCRRPPRRDPKPKPDPKPDESQAGLNWVKVRVIKIRAAAGGTAITINHGSNHGVQTGWIGKVVDAKGKAIPDGEFTITSVGSNTANAKVSAAPDAVSSAKRAIIKAP